jgi:hypothetical protein
VRATFSTPASANTTGVVADGVAPRLASIRIATLFTGTNVSYFRTTWYHVDGEAQILPIRRARTASVPVGTCRYSTAVTITLMTRISAEVSRWGHVYGQDG